MYGDSQVPGIANRPRPFWYSVMSPRFGHVLKMRLVSRIRPTHFDKLLSAPQVQHCAWGGAQGKFRLLRTASHGDGRKDETSALGINIAWAPVLRNDGRRLRKP